MTCFLEPKHFEAVKGQNQGKYIAAYLCVEEGKFTIFEIKLKMWQFLQNWIGHEGFFFCQPPFNKRIIRSVCYDIAVTQARLRYYLLVPLDKVKCQFFHFAWSSFRQAFIIYHFLQSGGRNSRSTKQFLNPELQNWCWCCSFFAASIPILIWVSCSLRLL